VIDLGRSCSRHRSALVDFVDHGEISDGTGRAFAHLEHCARCRDALESTALAITALRRFGDDLQAVEPPADAWPRLRARITTRRPMLMSPIAGAAMSVAIVAMLALPFRLAGAPEIRPQSQAPTTAPLVDDHELHVEAAYLATSRRMPVGPAKAVSGSLPMNIPEEVLQVRKEVHAAQPSWRSIPPI
jgi:hypothetical protein